MAQPRILVALHSSEGQTAKIGGYIADHLKAAGAVVDRHMLETAPPPVGYDALVLGDSIHMSKHSRALLDYLRRHVAACNATPSALFQVSLTSVDTDAEHAAKAQQMVRQLLDETGFAPDAVGRFAGALAYTSYGWVKRQMMRAVAQKSGLETDSSRDFEYTDWHAVDLFAEGVYVLATTASVDAVDNDGGART